MSAENVSDLGPSRAEERLASFGAALERAITGSGRSRAEIAAEVGVTESAISLWISGRREPEPQMVFRLEKATCLGSATGHLSRHLGYAPVERREQASVVAAVQGASELSAESKDRLLDLYRVLVRHDRAMRDLRNELMHGVRLEQAAEEVVEHGMGSGKTKDLMEALEASLRAARDARRERGTELPAEVEEEQ